MSVPEESPMRSLILRVLHDEDYDDQGNFNTTIFWGINIFLLVMLLCVCGYCWRNHRQLLNSAFGEGHPGGTASDLIYQQTVLDRQRIEAEKAMDTPEERKAKLAATFERVRMVVKEDDLMAEMSQTVFAIDENLAESRITVPDGHDNSKENTATAANIVDPNSASDRPDTANSLDLDLEAGSAANDDATTTIDDDAAAAKEEDYCVEECETGYLMLSCHRQVPNCCAICLSAYNVDDVVVWSSNKACKHAFHEECMIDYFTKMQDGTPCPCCRQSFCTNLDVGRKGPKKISWAPGSFNPNRIAFW